MIEPLSLEDSPNEKKFIYRGSSMHSTFGQGHVLYVRPESKKLRPGDVIVYRKGEYFIVHRVITVNGACVMTRGDNNSREDSDQIQLSQIVGAVEQVDDWGNTRQVTGGHKGLFLARLRWGFSAIFTWASPVVGAPYRWLKSSKLMIRIWHPKVIQVKTNSSLGPMIKYIVGGKTVATWIPNYKRFLCKRLYALVIFPPE